MKKKLLAVAINATLLSLSMGSTLVYAQDTAGVDPGTSESTASALTAEGIDALDATTILEVSPESIPEELVDAFLEKVAALEETEVSQLSPELARFIIDNNPTDASSILTEEQLAQLETVATPVAEEGTETTAEEGTEAAAGEGTETTAEEGTETTAEEGAETTTTSVEGESVDPMTAEDVEALTAEALAEVSPESIPEELAAAFIAKVASLSVELSTLSSEVAQFMLDKDSAEAPVLTEEQTVALKEVVDSSNEEGTEATTTSAEGEGADQMTAEDIEALTVEALAEVALENIPEDLAAAFVAKVASLSVELSTMSVEVAQFMLEKDSTEAPVLTEEQTAALKEVVGTAESALTAEAIAALDATTVLEVEVSSIPPDLMGDFLAKVASFEDLSTLSAEIAGFVLKGNEEGKVLSEEQVAALQTVCGCKGDEDDGDDDDDDGDDDDGDDDDGDDDDGDDDDEGDEEEVDEAELEGMLGEAEGMELDGLVKLFEGKSESYKMRLFVKLDPMLFFNKFIVIHGKLDKGLEKQIEEFYKAFLPKGWKVKVKVDKHGEVKLKFKVERKAYQFLGVNFMSWVDFEQDENDADLNVDLKELLKVAPPEAVSNMDEEQTEVLAEKAEELAADEETAAALTPESKTQLFFSLSMKGKDASKFAPPGWVVNAATSKIEMTVEAVQALSPVMLGGFNALQIGGFAPTVMVNITPMQIVHLKPTAMAGLTVEHVSNLTPEAVKALAPSQCAAIPPQAMGGLRAAHISNFSLDVIKALLATQIPFISVDAVVGFMVPQLLILSDQQKVAFTAQQRVKMPLFIFDPTYPEPPVYTSDVAEEEATEEEATEEEATEEEATEEEATEEEATEEEATEEEATEEEATEEEATEEEATEEEATEEEATEEEATEEEATEEEATEETVEVEMVDLGATAIDAEGNEITVNAEIEGALVVDGELQEEVSLDQEVEVTGEIALDPEHEGEVDDVFVYASYMPLGLSLEMPLFYMLNEDGGIEAWNQNPNDLTSFIKLKAKDKKSKSLKVPMYKGKFILPGILAIFFGYRLEDGTVVNNAEPINVTIDEPAIDDAAPVDEELPATSEEGTVTDEAPVDEELPATSEEGTVTDEAPVDEELPATSEEGTVTDEAPVDEELPATSEEGTVTDEAPVDEELPATSEEGTVTDEAPVDEEPPATSEEGTVTDEAPIDEELPAATDEGAVTDETPAEGEATITEEQPPLDEAA